MKPVKKDPRKPLEAQRKKSKRKKNKQLLNDKRRAVKL